MTREGGIGLHERAAAGAAAAAVADERPFSVDAHGKPAIPLEAAALYGFGHLLRETESLLLRLFTEGLLSGTTHTCIGQELCQMAVVRALPDPRDAVLSNHRNHGHFLTYSGDFLGLVAEIMGREAGMAGGIGGSQHLAFRNFHSNGVQGGMTAIGAGLALARKLRGERAVVALMLGDGTLGQGLVYESMNLASIWKLPMIFVVENNHIAQTTPTAETTGGKIEARGAAFGLTVTRIADTDPELFQIAEQTVARARMAEPQMLVIDTARLGPHSKGDDLRPASEMENLRRRDPLRRLGDSLPEGEREAIERANRDFLRRVEREALASPEASRLVAKHAVFRPARPVSVTAPAAEGNLRAHLNAALRELLHADPRVLLLGEDLHDPYGGAFKVTAGLSTEFPGRVISTPISEAGVIGAGIGLAMAGWRPVVEMMFADFLTLGMDQIFNHAVKFPGMFDEIEVPLVIRAASGGRRGYGPTHSQSPENLLAAIPGLTVVCPSHRHDAGLLLKNVVLCWPNPTVFLEHKLLYGEPCASGPFREVETLAEDPGLELFPTLAAGSEDPDVTLVTYGGMLPHVERLAEELRGEELSAEIVVPCLIAPLPRHQLAGLLRGREHVVVIEEGFAEYGFGKAIGSMLAESGYRGRFAHVHAPPVPIPAARSLEEQVIPGRSAMLEGVLRALGI